MFLSSEITGEALLLGTLRHRLFEDTLQKVDFSPSTIRDCIESIVREAAEDIVGCPGMTSHSATTELFKVVPQVKRFIDDFTAFASPNRRDLTKLDGNHGQPPVFIRARKVHAIEETINSPEMGIKGNIDAVIQTSIAGSLSESPKEALVGVELKTGHSQRTDQSHMAQLALYNLMLQARYGMASQSGEEQRKGASEVSILLYINAESVKTGKLSPSVYEIKSLIGQRNVVAVKQKQTAKLRGVELCFENDSKWPKAKLLGPPPPALPPVENSSMCEKCYMARECTLYASVEGACGEKDGPIAHPDLLQQYTNHLSNEEIEYFSIWDRLLDFEESAMVRPVAMKWLRSSTELETSSGRSASCLVVKKVEGIPGIPKNKGQIMKLVYFERAQCASQRSRLSSLAFAKDSHVIISADDVTTGIQRRYNRPLMHLARGIVHHLRDDEIVLRVSESDVARIEKIFSDTGETQIPTFRLDRDEVATGLGILRRNLINLLTGDKIPAADKPPLANRLPKLREIILRKCEPTYSPLKTGIFNPPKSISFPDIPSLHVKQMSAEFAKMNSDQRRSILKVMTANDYTLIQGMPGTGKTSTISFLIRLLVAHGKRVLVTSYTHTAVDNVLMKLISSGIDQKRPDGTRIILRIGDTLRCHEDVKHLLANAAASEKENVTGNDMPTAESLRHCIRKACVVGVTALTIPNSPLLAGEEFDVVIVDEAGQMSQPATIGALMAADKFVLVGDHMQLPPLVNSELAEAGGYAVSMLKRLAEGNPRHVAQLTQQYRMAEDICQLTNDIIYGGKLKCANEAIKRRKMLLPGYPENVLPGVLSKVIDPNKTVVFLDTDQRKHGCTDIVPLECTADKKEGGSLMNKTEATLVERIVESLVFCGASLGSIGIISPFNAQLRLLDSSHKISSWKSQGLECSTIDRYQGRDKAIIILSFVRSNEKGKVGRLLADPNRINVAVSRAE